jgi:hypothetical protein
MPVVGQPHATADPLEAVKSVSEKEMQARKRGRHEKEREAG